MWVSTLLVFLAFARGSSADTCQSCVAQKNLWCVESNTCQDSNCKTTIRNTLNCPMTPQSGFEYSDDFARKVSLPIIVAAMLPNPMTCLKNAVPTATVSSYIHAKCSEEIGPNTTCHAYTAYDVTQKVIIVSFRGTDSPAQLTEEFESFTYKKEPFFDNGHVYKYFYDGFIMLWQQGLEASVRNLRYLYPTFDFWVMGHSLGGALASVGASYIVKVGISTPEQMKLLTYGQPRTGDKAFAQWHDSTFLYSYRIVHNKDIVPHIPPMGGPDEVWHHRYEIWYNNTMAVGDPWYLCTEDDGPYCSNTELDVSTGDHVKYFRDDMYNWAFKGCHPGQ